MGDVKNDEVQCSGLLRRGHRGPICANSFMHTGALTAGMISVCLTHRHILLLGNVGSSLQGQEKDICLVSFVIPNTWVEASLLFISVALFCSVSGLKRNLPLLQLLSYQQWQKFSFPHIFRLPQPLILFLALQKRHLLCE